MISKDDIKKLATLSRIDMDDAETEKLAGEVGSILEYVGQIKEAQVGTDAYIFGPHNVMREDIPINESSEHTEVILKNAPKRDGNYVSVKKIL